MKKHPAFRDQKRHKHLAEKLIGNGHLLSPLDLPTKEKSAEYWFGYRVLLEFLNKLYQDVK